ncbi:uncharacterized protein [Leptinotarsa decemlineata]|uniref:uncharacterized protein n=1 Tax=Leptinotarsa decemlineata TaxID=7539 RepID=UPI003D30945E
MAEPKKRFFKYTEAQLQQALSDITNNVCKIRQAERLYGVPHATLINKLKGRSSLTRRMGPSTILTEDEEELLVRWLLASAKKGFPINKTALCETVKDIMKDDERIHKFRDGMPGKKWFSAFMKRHPEVCQRHAESINGARACVTEKSIREWHESIRTYLKEENAEDILNDPRRILNSDESGFATNPKTGLVLGPRGMKNFYEVKTGSEKECITALFTISADGRIYPPMIVYPYERIPAEIVRNTNPEWVIGRSKKGWMTSETFFSYVCNTLLPFLQNEGIKLPILYILDGHKSHLTYNLSKFCSENGIFLYALLPNATHILQPAVVSLFAPLKSKWKKVVADWKKANNNKIVNKATFPLLLETTVQQIGADTVKNGFRRCGLYPFEVEAVDFKKCMHDTSRTVGDQEGIERIKPTNFDVPNFLYFESLIPTKRREEFKKAEMGEWVGDESAKELYAVWRKLKKRCQGKNNEENNNDIELKKFETNETVEEVIEVESKIQENNDETEYQKFNADTEVEEYRNDTGIKENGSDQEPNLCEVSIEKNAADKEKQVIVLSDILIKKPVTPVPPPQSQKRKVSVAFLDHIFWPEESPEKKESTRKERLPYATTSLKWLQYHEEKENTKMEKEREKQERALLRQKKQEEKLKKPEMGNPLKRKEIKKIKRKVNKAIDSSESEYEEWQESGSSLDDITEHFSSDSEDEPLASIVKKVKKDIAVGDFYLVAFPGKKTYHNYVCSVQNIYDTGEVEVHAFTPIEESKNVFKVIENDISVVNAEQLVKRLEYPSVVTTGNRIKYKFLKDVI